MPFLYKREKSSVIGESKSDNLISGAERQIFSDLKGKKKD